MKQAFRDPLRPRTPGPFRIGDRVRLLWGFTPVEAIVVEDRGNRGAKGARFYRVWLRLDKYTDPFEIEGPAADLTLISRPRKGRRAKSPDDPTSDSDTNGATS